MKKTFMGVRLRKLRAERGLSQIAMANELGLSPSYLNQLEQNQRPLTVAVLLKIHRTLGVDVQQFSEDEEARLIAGMREALADAPEQVTLPELEEVAAQMPALGRALIALHRRNLEAMEQLETMALRLGDDRSDVTAPRATPFEVVRDFFVAHQNHFDGLDRAAESLAGEAEASGGTLTEWLAQRLLQKHGVRVLFAGDTKDIKRHYEPAAHALRLSSALGAAQQAFQLGTQLALLELGDEIESLMDAPPLTEDVPSRKLARIGLANYFAGALLLPYGKFLQAAESLRYDIDLLGQRFGVGFETVCHRLSSLQRPAAPGVPFFFVRVDRAGNISKRQSATHFHFSRTGGTCPLWNVYEAFGQPGHILTQLASMPDGRTYLWIARTVSRGQRGYGSPRKTFSIGLGCDIRHAPRLVYAKGLDLRDPEAATPIGMGCKVCERMHCPQRAFPFVGRPLDVDENQSRFTPYGIAW
ncbi:short-chain fatty acyl-CoA regulator family protein [Variovorax soli]|uniref:Transcriptional regulator/transcriptional regulator with XRE-family HTH domain n=1 Tax=Variovorax soli TaxID=376815 RepID=A0ABU1NJF4_9BURK|nr:short-chain fatty acyl-CoA regulator family protein [Variovorax soli]MDR6538598.1 putative transcriptional regulator/transcriptional regulator with XRE-family HTH domain [Variovorax soli]